MSREGRAEETAPETIRADTDHIHEEAKVQSRRPFNILIQEPQASNNCRVPRPSSWNLLFCT